MIIIEASNGKVICPGHGSCICVNEDDIVDLSNESIKSFTLSEFYDEFKNGIPELDPKEIETLPDQE